MSDLLHGSFDALVQGIIEHSPLGIRLELVLDVTATEALLMPIQIAAALKHAGMPDGRAAKVQILSGASLAPLDAWRWTTFTHLISGSPHRVTVNVLNVRSLLRNEDGVSEIKDALPSVRIRTLDASELQRSLDSAGADVLLVAADALFRQAHSDDASFEAVMSAIRTHPRVYVISHKCPRGPILAAALQQAGISAEPIAIPVIDGMMSPVMEWILAPLCAVDFGVRPEPSTRGELIGWRMFQKDQDFVGLSPACKRFDSLQRPDGTWSKVLRLYADAFYDPTDNVIHFGPPYRGSQFALPAGLDPLPLALDQALLPALEKTFAFWPAAFIEMDRRVHAMADDMDAMYEAISAVRASFGVTIPPVPSAAPGAQIYQAIEGGRASRLLSLLRSGVNADVARAVDGRTPLIFAAALKSELVDVLLDYAYEIDRVDHYGWTALSYLVAHGLHEYVGSLLDHGADLDHQLPNGVSLRTLYDAMQPIHKRWVDSSGWLKSSEASVDSPAPEAASETTNAQRIGMMSKFLPDATDAAWREPAGLEGAGNPLSQAIAAATPPAHDDLGLLAGASELINQLAALSDLAPAPLAVTPLPEAALDERLRQRILPRQPVHARPKRRRSEALVQVEDPPAIQSTTTAAPPAPSIEKKRFTVLVSQGQLGRDGSAADVMIKARRIVADWLRHGRGKVVVDPDQLTWDHADGFSTVLAEGHDKLWAVRFEHHADHGMVWRAEVVLADIQDVVHVGVRLTRLGDDPSQPDPVSIPGVVRDFATSLGWRADGLAMAATARVVREHRAVEGLISLIQRPDRALPVVVVGIPHGDWLDHDVLATRLVGVAHVVAIDRARAGWLGTVLGRDLGLPGESARVYRPGFADGDDAQHNPIIHRGSAGTAAQIRERIIRAAVRATRWRSSDDDIPTYTAVRLLLAEARTPIEVEIEVPFPPAVSDAGVIGSKDEAPALVEAPLAGTDAALAELRALMAAQTKELVELRSSAASLRETLERTRSVREEDRAETKELLDRLKVENAGLREEHYRLRQVIRSLRATIDDLQSYRTVASGEDAAVVFPDSFDELPSWAARYLGDDVILLPRAIKAAQDSPLAEPRKAYEALWLLKEYYVPTLYGDRDAAAELDAQCKARGLEVCKVGMAAVSHRYKAQYEITWRGRYYTMDRHVSGNSSRDPKLTLRVYFAVDEDSATVLVGFLPGHLDNRLS